VLVENLGLVRSLSLMNPDGTGVRAIYTIPASETQDGCDYGTIRWSPAGTQIAFPRRPAGSANQCRVFVMNADGTGAHQLTTNAGLWFETDLRWSPDGQRLAFDRWEMDSAGTWVIRPIGVVAAGGGPAQSLGPTPVSDGAAFEWSPDGRSLTSVPATVLSWPPSTSMPEARPTVIDATSGEAHEAAWSVNSWPTWQRLAP
jgi:dipeptidyl aminopeptidase/acylaminoacyl peptidase